MNTSTMEYFIKKYLRTYHMPFSPGMGNDDKVMPKELLAKFERKQIIITEKFDGGNCALKPNFGVFARSHSLPTDCETFNLIKNVHYFSKLHILNPNYWYFGENMFAIHSIIYENILDTFYLFNIYDTINKVWLSWEDVVNEAARCGFYTVPVIYQGEMMSLKELENFTSLELKKDSNLVGPREGFVLRLTDSFTEGKDFFQNIIKYVRKDHVQSDEHWKKNWKPQKLNLTLKCY